MSNYDRDLIELEIEITYLAQHFTKVLQKFNLLKLKLEEESNKKSEAAEKYVPKEEPKKYEDETGPATLPKRTVPYWPFPTDEPVKGPVWPNRDYIVD